MGCTPYCYELFSWSQGRYMDSLLDLASCSNKWPSRYPPPHRTEHGKYCHTAYFLMTIDNHISLIICLNHARVSHRVSLTFGFCCEIRLYPHSVLRMEWSKIAMKLCSLALPLCMPTRLLVRFLFVCLLQTQLTVVWCSVMIRASPFGLDCKDMIRPGKSLIQRGCPST